LWRAGGLFMWSETASSPVIPLKKDKEAENGENKK